MTELFKDGFDLYGSEDDALDGRWDSLGSGVTYSSSLGRFGGGCFRSTQAGAGTQMAQLCLAPVSTPVIGGAFKNTGIVRDRDIIAFRDGGTDQLKCQLNLNCTLSLLRGSTVLATSTLLWPKGVYMWVEMKATFANAGGTCTIRINEVDYIAFTGDTQETGNTTCDLFRFNRVDPSSGGYEALLDDLYIFDTNGSTNNDFIGDARIPTLYPDGDSVVQWTPQGGGDNYVEVDDGDAGPDDDTTYVHSDTAGQRELYTFDDLPVTPQEIYSISYVQYARKTDAGARTIRGSVQSNAADGDGATYGPSTDYVYKTDILETDPSGGGAWTEARINAILGGPEVVT